MIVWSTGGFHGKAREALMLFKARLGRFVRVYSYIAYSGESCHPFHGKAAT